MTKNKSISRPSTGQIIPNHPEKKIEVHSETFNGPLPPPKYLQQYEDIHPGLAERIVASWEKETDHRHSLERIVVAAEVEAQKHIPREICRGQYLAFVLSVGFLAAGIYMVTINQPIAGTVVSGTGFVGIIVAFLSTAFISRKTQNGQSPQSENDKT